MSLYSASLQRKKFGSVHFRKKATGRNRATWAQEEMKEMVSYATARNVLKA